MFFIRLLSLIARSVGGGCSGAGALQCPEKQGGQPGILFQRAGRAVAGLGLCCAQHLL